MFSDQALEASIPGPQDLPLHDFWVDFLMMIKFILCHWSENQADYISQEIKTIHSYLTALASLLAEEVDLFSYIKVNYAGM